MIVADLAFDIPLLIAIASGGTRHDESAHGAAFLYYKTIVQSPPVNALVLANLAPMVLPYLRWRSSAFAPVRAPLNHGVPRSEGACRRRASAPRYLRNRSKARPSMLVA